MLKSMLKKFFAIKNDKVLDSVYWYVTCGVLVGILGIFGFLSYMWWNSHAVHVLC